MILIHDADGRCNHDREDDYTACADEDSRRTNALICATPPPQVALKALAKKEDEVGRALQKERDALARKKKQEAQAKAKKAADAEKKAAKKAAKK